MEHLIANGLVVTPAGILRADVRISGERIAAIGTGFDSDVCEVIDASGCYVLPGAIDAHTHLGWPDAADDFAAGTIAAACGGVTTVVDFAVPFGAERSTDAAAQWRTKADGVVAVDYGLHAVVRRFDDGTADEMAALIDAGITSFKMWMTSRHSGGLGVDDGVILRVMEVASRLGALVGLHCENDALIETLVGRFVGEGKTTPLYHRLSRPSFVEAEAIRRAATIAEAVDCQMYIPHLSSVAGLLALMEARARGARVVAETCPQFLTLTDAVYERPDGWRYMMSPPIKGEEDRDALWRAVAGGDIMTVGSDHCPYSDEIRSRGGGNFALTPNGVPGVETLLPLLYGEGVARGRLSLEQLVNVTAEQPARLFGLYPLKGTVQPGADADLVIWDPHRPARLGADRLHSRIGYSLYEDVVVPASPRMTMSRGTILARDGAFTGQLGHGRFLSRGRSDATVWERHAHG